MTHFYDKEGNPQHYVERADGKGTRDSTLRDARKHGWLPSVTGIIGILDKPGLNNWFQNKLLYAALTLPRVEGESDSEFLKRVRQDAAEEAEEAKLRGNLIHKCLEDMWSDKTGEDMDYPPDVMAIAGSAIADICNYCGESDFIPEKTVAGDGYGGSVDLHNDEFLIDFKTKAMKEGDTGKKLAYREHLLQLIAYDKALGGSPRRLVNVFIDRETSGIVEIHEWSEQTEVDSAWEEFQHLLRVWQLRKNYVPEQI